MSSIFASYVLQFILFDLCMAHMSMKFPIQRTNSGSYPTWESNEPMIPARPKVCHGLPAETVPAANRFAAGDVIEFEFFGSTSHDGGHCSFWVSTDEVTFRKIVDIKDCTLAPEQGRQVLITLPDTLPVECMNGCVFAWSWIPGVSGTCEIYSTCADISVSGLTGRSDPNPQDYVFQDIIDRGLCQRVDRSTHWSRLFSPIKQANGRIDDMGDSGSSNPSVPEVGGGSGPGNVVDVSNGNGIQITVRGTNDYWFLCRVSNVANGYEVNYIEVGGTVCDGNGNMYECNAATPFNYPLDVSVISMSGIVLTQSDVITSNVAGATYDLGVNFAGGPTRTRAPVGCGNIAPYRAGMNYYRGDRVVNQNEIYECGTSANVGEEAWCDDAAWAYAPGTGSAWNQAWTYIGDCRANSAMNVDDDVVDNGQDGVVITKVNGNSDNSSNLSILVVLLAIMCLVLLVLLVCALTWIVKYQMYVKQTQHMHIVKDDDDHDEEVDGMVVTSSVSS